MLELHNNYSPIFEAPFVDIHSFCIDWLHCCDLGVCQDYLGNAMWLITTKLPGDNIDERIRCLFDDIRQYYASSGCENQLGTLTPLMVRKKASKSPKLRSKAGEARSLVDWVVAACDKFLGLYGLSSEEHTCRMASKHLQACYQNLPGESFDADDLAFHCKQFLQLCRGGILNTQNPEATIQNNLRYMALENAVQPDARWRYKPKFHLWLHVCEMAKASPTYWWTYRDESFGGTSLELK